MLKWFLFWIGFCTVEYWILGPFSYARFWDDVDVGVARILYDIHNHLGGTFLHGIQGGADRFGSFGSTGDYVDLETILFTIFPVWLAYSLHKISLVTVSLFGSWLLFRAVTGINSFQAFCLGTLVSVYNPYALFNTVQHGLGYAFLPLAIYLYVVRNGQRNYFLYTTILSFFMAISCSPLISFPVILFGVLLSTLFLKIKNFPPFLISVIILCGLVLLNNLETLYGYGSYGLISARVVDFGSRPGLKETIFSGWIYLLGKTDFAIFGHIFYPILWLTLIVVAVALYSKATSVWRMVAFILLTLHIGGVIASFPWEKFHLSFIHAINFYRFSYIMMIPLCLLAGHIIKNNHRKFVKCVPFVFLFVSIFIVLSSKKVVVTDFLGKMYWASKLDRIPSLVGRNWKPKELYRVVTAGPYLGIHPNLPWGYDIETLDGYVSLVPDSVSKFWHYGVHRAAFSENSSPKMSGGNMYITYMMEENPSGARIELTGKSDVDLDEYIDLNLLKLANVSHIISYVPLRGKDLSKISGPDSDPEYMTLWKRGIPMRKKLRIGFSNLFDRPDPFIYKVSDYSERAFFPSRVKFIDSKLNISEKYRFISANYEKNIGFAEDAKLVPGWGQVRSVQEVRDGYEVVVSVTSPGVFVLNAFPLKFWRVYVDDNPVTSFPVNLIHLGVSVDVGEHKITYRYERPLLRDKLLALWRRN